MSYINQNDSKLQNLTQKLSSLHHYTYLVLLNLFFVKFRSFELNVGPIVTAGLFNFCKTIFQYECFSYILPHTLAPLKPKYYAGIYVQLL